MFVIGDGMGASNRDVNNHLSLNISREGADYLQVTIMCSIYSDDDTVRHRDNSIEMQCGLVYLVSPIRYGK